MSSHHFVKEDQEPALIIHDASSIPFASIEELLEWSPTLIVSEQALAGVLLWGIKIDVVISVQKNVQHYVDLLNDQAPVKILSHQPSESPLTTALYFLIAGKYRAVNVTGVELKVLQPFTTTLDVVAFIEHKRWSFARNGKFEKWLTQGSRIAIKGEEEVTVSKIGVDENLRVITDGLVTLSGDGPFWVGEDY